MSNDKEDWITAAAALALLEPVMGEFMATRAIAARAEDGLIRARADRFIRHTKVENDVEVPAGCWWARGGDGLIQNWITGDFETWINREIHLRAYGVRFFRADIERMLPPGTAKKPSARAKSTQTPRGTKLFIGHGHSGEWRILKDFIVDRLKLSFDEFNAEPAAGMTNVERLSEMLDNAAFAFLVLTAEDEVANGGVQARMNVIHEAGLFQGRLGFKKAIVLLEHDCSEFSNIAGPGSTSISPRGYPYDFRTGSSGTGARIDHWSELIYFATLGTVVLSAAFNIAQAARVWSQRRRQLSRLPLDRRRAEKWAISLRDAR